MSPPPTSPLSVQGDTALLVRLAAALLPDDEGGEGEEGDEEDAGSQEGETLSMHDTLLKQVRRYRKRGRRACASMP